MRHPVTKLGRSGGECSPHNSDSHACGLPCSKKSSKLRRDRRHGDLADAGIPVAELAVGVVAPALDLARYQRGAGVCAARADPRGRRAQPNFDWHKGRHLAAIAELSAIILAPAIDLAVALQRAAKSVARRELGDRSGQSRNFDRGRAVGGLGRVDAELAERVIVETIGRCAGVDKAGMCAPAGDAAVGGGAGIRLERECTEYKLNPILYTIPHTPLNNNTPTNQPTFNQPTHITLQQTKHKNHLTISLHQS